MIGRRLILRREVPADLLDIHDYLATHSAAVAGRFLESARRTMERHVAHPGIGSPKAFKGKLRGVRSWAVDGFSNHLIYFKTSATAVIVLGILHGSRDVSNTLRRRRS